MSSMKAPISKFSLESIGWRKFEITLLSASNLENVRRGMGTMSVHARVSIGGKPEIPEKRTPADTHGGTNPAWSFSMGFIVSEKAVQYLGTMLVVKLYAERTLGDRYIGEVHISFKELFDYAESAGRGGSAVMTLPLQNGREKSKQGSLKFSYRFEETVFLDERLLAEAVSTWSLPS